MSDNMLVRAFTPELQVRSAAKGGDGRTVEGICVPYRQRQRIDASLVEMFAPGAFSHQLRAANRVHFARDHLALGGTLIGKTIELRDDPAGLWGAWRVSKTPVGELVSDGVLDELSVGFRARKDRAEPDGTVVREKADLVEVAVVLEGAYGRGALISGVRERAGQVCGLCCGTGVLGDPDPDTDQARSRSNLAVARQVLAQLPPLPAA